MSPGSAPNSLLVTLRNHGPTIALVNVISKASPDLHVACVGDCAELGRQTLMRLPHGDDLCCGGSWAPPPRNACTGTAAARVCCLPCKWRSAGGPCQYEPDRQSTQSHAHEQHPPIHVWDAASGGRGRVTHDAVTPPRLSGGRQQRRSACLCRCLCLWSLELPSSPWRTLSSHSGVPYIGDSTQSVTGETKQQPLTAAADAAAGTHPPPRQPLRHPNA